MISLFKVVIFRFHVSFQGCKFFRPQLCGQGHLGTGSSWKSRSDKLSLREVGQAVGDRFSPTTEGDPKKTGFGNRENPQKWMISSPATKNCPRGIILGVSNNFGYPKMDGENNGKPY